MARKTRKSSASKKSGAAKKRGAKRGAAKRAGARRSAASKRGRAMAKSRPAKRRTGAATVARVRRVTREVVEQATGGVAAGVETLKDLGENLVDRMRSNDSSGTS